MERRYCRSTRPLPDVTGRRITPACAPGVIVSSENVFYELDTTG